MKIEKSLLRDLCIALLVFLPSLVPVPLLFHLLILPLVLPKKIKLTITLQLLILIICLSFVNQILNINIFFEQGLGVKDLIPYSLFILVSYFFGISVNQRVLKFIVYLVIFEIFIGVLEYFSGTRSFIPSVKEAVSGDNPFGFRGMLYYSRVSGLSSNSSVLAIKAFVAILLVHFLNFKSKRKEILLYVLLGIGLLITFTRSVYVAVAVFVLLANFIVIKTTIIRFFKGKSKWFYLVLVLLFIPAIGFLISKKDVLFRQLNRGRKSIDLSSRDIVYEKFSGFIKEHLIFGNGSYKIWINIDNKIFHAHNVYMQTIATNGIIIATLFFLIILININRTNFKYVFPILVISIFQYAIFWGISFTDLIFFSFLLLSMNKNLSKTSNIKEL